jgi:hypothetical protein
MKRTKIGFALCMLLGLGVSSFAAVPIGDNFSTSTITDADTRLRLDDLGPGWYKHADSLWSISGGVLTHPCKVVNAISSEGLVGQVVSSSGLNSTNTQLEVSFDYMVGAGSSLYFHLVGLTTNGAPVAAEALANTKILDGGIQNQSEADFGDLNLLTGDAATGVGADTVSLAGFVTLQVEETT